MRLPDPEPRARALDRALRKAWQRLRYRALADPDRTVWIDRAAVRSVLRDKHLRRRYFPGVVLGSFGDEQPVPLEIASRERFKPRALRDHFLDGVPWLETELFRRVYAERLARGESIRGCRTLDALADDYATRIDGLFESMKRDGLMDPATGDGSIRPVFVHIGSGGEIIHGADGNHRLYLAEILGIESMPFRIFSRHHAWQEVRECARLGGAALAGRGLAHHLGHPDLQDLIGSPPGS